ncbi:MAG: type IV pili twitching motility protein PilT, partial [Candidatus Methylomirabilis sp.]|nr:type IV pili twitching motility protein PilT [Deltaproteobacteria bacterium]
MHFNEILWKAVELGASDVHVRVGLPPIFRLHGQLYPMQTEFRFDADNVKAIVGSILTPALRKRFQDDRQVDLS